MDRTAAIAELPEAYAAAVRARDEALSNAEIAARLDIEFEAVEPLLRLAAAKLAAILADHGRSPQTPEDTRDLSERTTSKHRCVPSWPGERPDPTLGEQC